jgi:hypothetical protein
MLAVPAEPAGKPALLLLDSRSREQVAAPGGDFDTAARSGYIVFAIAPRGVAETADRGRESILGQYGDAMRAALIGKTLVGMRAEDIIRSIDYLMSRSDLKLKEVSSFGQGALGVALLHAAVLDKRISNVVVQDTLASYKITYERPVHRALYDVAVPGALRRYDLDQLVAAVGPSRMLLLNPVDAAGNPLRAATLRQQYAGKARVEYRPRRDSLVKFLRSGSSDSGVAAR